ncbi:SURF1 family protein [Paraglaciecola chathamensis]|uniref:SURF1 family protein n=1 Tax=Paraglaciecola chathamensis TaxID=368405 RepID=UPI0026FFDAC2|nr:SURF1 family protein [Paraglaciecola chathamensis]MDO6840300.1 SURF1 family protein [Paraglaciecola chathamensis]
MFALANWQLQRGLDKAQRMQSIDSASNSASYSLETLLTRNQDIQDLPISFSGSINPQHVFLLDNRIKQGRPGFDVYVIAQSDTHNVLVNFGWVAGKQMRDDLPEVSLPDRLNDAQGRIVLPSDNPMVTETATHDALWPKVIQQIDIQFIEQVLHAEVLPFVITLTQSNEQFIRDWQPVVMPPEKHYAYAVQWLGLGIAAFFVYFFALRARLRSGLKKGSHEQNE